MLQSKLLDVLKKFSPKELRGLDDVVQSPFFNKSEEVCQLYTYVLKYAPKFDHKNLDRKIVLEKGFDGKADEKKLSYWMSDLLRLTEKYLVHRELDNQPVKQAYSLLEQYNEFGLEKHYHKIQNDVGKQLNKQPYRDAQFYYDSFLIESANNRHFDHQRKRMFDDSLQKTIDNLDLYYLTLKLRHTCEIYNRKNVVAADYKVQLLDEILTYVEKTDLSGAPIVQIYYTILMTLTNSEEDHHFQQLKQLLIEHSNKLTREEARVVYQYANNYCIKKINRGDKKYQEELFSLYQQTLENKVAFAGKHLSPWTYKNIVGIGLLNKKYDWTEQFIHQYAEHLRLEFRQNALDYNLASLYFATKRYEDAQDLLRNVEFTDVFYNLDAKAMLLRIYYEQNSVEALMSLLDSFRVYLKRNKLISDYQRTIYLNLLKFVKALLKVKKRDKEKLQELREAVASTKQVAYSLWLLDKIDELN